LDATLPERTRILLVDDHPLVRRAVRDILEREPDLEVVGEAGDGLQAVELTGQYDPDIVIMDISMPRMNGVEATKQIKASNPQVAVLILTVHTDVETIFSILQAGASG
jgi:DNA-binding NarL/FixJ family response regulator